MSCQRRENMSQKSKLQKGEHMHNHLETPGDYSGWADTEEKRKWAAEKTNNPDRIIFTRVGKFYEFFHEDADIIHSVIDAPYMFGQVAWTGIPESALESVQNKLKDAGYEKISVLF